MISLDLLALVGLITSSLLLILIGIAYLPKQHRYNMVSILTKAIGAIILIWFIWSWFHVISTLIGG